MKELKAYLANQWGFSEIGKKDLDTIIKPRLKEIGLIVNDPFLECGKELDFKYMEKLTRYQDRMNYWKDFNKKVTPINNKLMKDSDCLLAILDGGPDLDSGVASEIGYYAGIERGPIFALRSDFRLSENIAASINAQVLGYIEQSGGELVCPPNALENWFNEIRAWYNFKSRGEIIL